MAHGNILLDLLPKSVLKGTGYYFRWLVFAVTMALMFGGAYVYNLSSDNLHTLLWKSESGSCDFDPKHANAKESFESFRMAVHSVIPAAQNFSKSFSNPCWYMPLNFSQAIMKQLWHRSMTDEEATAVLREIFNHETTQKTLFCIPKVFFAGYPKSASTTLHELILRHPLIVSGARKEPHWWTKYPYNPGFPHNILTVLMYLKLYRSASDYIQQYPGALAIDSSQSTIWDTQRSPNICDIPRLISTVVPDAKYIVIMREPISRLFSDFTFLCVRRQRTSFTKSFSERAADIFHEATLKKVEEFEKCLGNSTESLCTRYSLDEVANCREVRMGISLYYIHIAKWLGIVPREQFLFLRTEDLASDPYFVLREIWNFLGISALSKQALGDSVYFHNKTNPLTLGAMQAHIRPDTWAKLQEFYRPYNSKLAKLLDDDRFLWNDV